MRLCWILIATLFCSLLSLRAPAAAEQGGEGDEHVTAPRTGDGLPRFKHPYSDGLYSTVTAMNMFYVPNVPNEKKIKLKVPNFKREMPVHVIMQNHPAPLVVVLMGVDGKVDGPWGGLFPYWYAEAGYHVLTFDGTFTPGYPSFCGLGVVGNFSEEADQIAAIVDAFLKTDTKKQVQKIGVVGMSFGASQAMLMAAKAKEGKLPFELSGCLALSPPVKLKTSAQILDRFYAEDRWDTTMVELAKKFMSHLPVAEGQKVPFAATEMRAAIGFAFRDGLCDVVDRNDSLFKLKVLPSGDIGTEENRASYAEATGLERFVEKFTFPYWQKKGKVKNVEEIWEMGELSKVLPRLPDYAEVVVAANDPFNTVEDLEAAKTADVNHRLTVVPTGGHLGYIAADWTLVKALRIFGGKYQAVVDDKRTPDEARKEAVDAIEEARKRDKKSEK